MRNDNLRDLLGGERQYSTYKTGKLNYKVRTLVLRVVFIERTRQHTEAGR